MKIIGSDENSRTVIVNMSRDEWNDLQAAAGVRYDQRSDKPGAGANTKLCRESVEAFNELSSVRKDFSKCFGSWEKLMNKMDLLLGVNEKK